MSEHCVQPVPAVRITLVDSWRNRLRRGALMAVEPALWVALGLCALVALSGCSLTQVDQSTGPTTVTVEQPSPAPTSSPAPAVSPSPSRGAVAAVEVHYFGKSQGTPGKDLRVGEVGDVTASPYDANGVDVGQPTDPVAWSCTGGVAFTQSQSNRYNGVVTGKTVGAYTCAATAGGVTGSLAGNVVP